MKNYQINKRNKHLIRSIILFIVYTLIVAIFVTSFKLHDYRYYIFFFVILLPLSYAFEEWEFYIKFQKGLNGENKVGELLKRYGLRPIRNVEFETNEYTFDIDIAVFIKGELWIFEVKNWKEMDEKQISQTKFWLGKRTRDLRKLLDPQLNWKLEVHKRIVFIKTKLPENTNVEEIIFFKDLESFLIEKIKENKEYDHELEKRIYNQLIQLKKLE